jgi:hypothetical protein
LSGLHCSCFLGLCSSVDQSSEQKVKDWEDILGDTLKMFQKSPLGKRSKNFDHVLDLMLKWMGLNTDHCSKAKKTSCLISEKKTDAVVENLGENKVLDKSFEETGAVFEKFRMEMIGNARGLETWNALEKHEQSIHIASMIKEATKAVGENLFSDLSTEEQWELQIFYLGWLWLS